MNARLRQARSQVKKFFASFFQKRSALLDGDFAKKITKKRVWQGVWGTAMGIQALGYVGLAATSLDDWANIVGTSVRTLARLFRKEFGVTFILWRQQVRMMAALPRLASGESVTSIATDLGYESPGAFTQVFRRLMGAVPSTYFED